MLVSEAMLVIELSKVEEEKEEIISLKRREERSEKREERREKREGETQRVKGIKERVKW